MFALIPSQNKPFCLTVQQLMKENDIMESVCLTDGRWNEKQILLVNWCNGIASSSSVYSFVLLSPIQALLNV